MKHRGSTRMRAHRLIVGAAGLALLVGCGGGGASSALPSAGGAAAAPSSGRVTQTISLVIPAKGYADNRRVPQYTSISTKGIGISLVLQGQSAPTNPATLTTPDVAIDLATTPISILGDLGPNGQTIACTAVTAPQPGQQCTLALSLPPDVAAIVVNAWDAPPASGSTAFSPSAQLLSTAVAGIKVTSGAAGPTIPLVLDGVPAALQIVPTTPQAHFVPGGSGSTTSAAAYTAIGGGPIAVTFNALDADGNIIIGIGAPTVQWQLAQTGSPILTGSVVSGASTNLSLASALTSAAAFATPFTLTATSSAPGGSPLASAISIQPAQELWLPGNTSIGGTTGRGPQAIGSTALSGFEIPPPTGALMSAISLGTDTVPASSIAQCPVPTGATVAPFFSAADVSVDPSGNLWLLVLTPYSTATSSGQASCVEGLTVQSTENPPQPIPNSMRLLSQTDRFTGCAIDRFDTLWCIDASSDTLVGYNLQATGTAPFSTPNVTMPISLPTGGATTNPISIAVQPGGTNLWLAMAGSLTATTTTTTFYAREIPITTASSPAPSLGSPSNWAPFGTPYSSASPAGSVIPVADPPLAVDANDDIYSVDVGNLNSGAQAPLNGMWQPTLAGGTLSFGSTAASASYPFTAGQMNSDEPFAIGPDGALWTANSYVPGITRYSLSGATLTEDIALSSVPLPYSGSPPDGFAVVP